MRRLLTPRWLVRHALVLVLVGGCLLLGWWQYGRATGGNTLSWAYTVQWPLFAMFIAVLWWRAVRQERLGAAGETPVRAQPPPLRPVRPRRTTAEVIRPAAGAPADPEDEALEAYNRYLAWLAANPDRRRSDYPG